MKLKRRAAVKLNAIIEIAKERERQIAAEGYSEAHDDAHRHGELAFAAGAHALRAANLNRPKAAVLPAQLGPAAIYSGDLWPADWGVMKLHDQRRSLVIAAALLVAEIERLDRLGEGA